MISKELIVGLALLIVGATDVFLGVLIIGPRVRQKNYGSLIRNLLIVGGLLLGLLGLLILSGLLKP